MPNHGIERRSGVSTLEALLTVLIVAGALALALSAGSSARDGGFRVANRATAAGDAVLAADAFRTLVRGLAWPQGQPVTGDAAGLAGPAILERAIPCAAAGPAAGAALRLDRRDGAVLLTCASAGRPRAVLLDLGPETATLAYSTDGARWTADWRAPPDAQRLYVRLTARNGSVDWVEATQRRALARPEDLPR